MAALTAATGRKTRNIKGKVVYEPAVKTSSTIYQGGLVALVAATGRAVAASKAATLTDLVLGIAEETKTGNAAGTVRVKVASGIEALFTGETALTLAYLGTNACVSTDNEVTTASNAGTAGLQIKVGRVVQRETTLTWWVAVGSIAQNNV